MKFRILNLTAALITVGFVTITYPVFSQQTHQYRPADGGGGILSPPKRPGGSRSANIFVPQQPPVTALTPEQGGVTVKEYPSFFVFVPQALETTENLSAEFYIIDEQDNIIYETIIQIPLQASIIQIDLPLNEAATGLEINQTYQWYFAVRSSLETVETVSGAIQRIKPSLELVQTLKSLENTTLPQRPEVYQQEGIWYETLSILAEIRQAKPDDPELINQWKKLLESVGLEDIKDIPLAAITLNSSQSSDSENSASSTRFRPPDISDELPGISLQLPNVSPQNPIIAEKNNQSASTETKANQLLKTGNKHFQKSQFKETLLSITVIIKFRNNL